MKRTLSLLLVVFILLIPISILAQDEKIPSPSGEFYVNDFAGVLDSQTEQYILEQSLRLKELSQAQVVVVTVNTIGDNPLEFYSLDILRDWGIGDKDKNNGVLILLAVDDRKSRIEVGYGLEGALPDGKTGRIQDDYMLPYYQEGDYAAGILEGYKAILVEVYMEYNIDPGNLEEMVPNRPLYDSNSETQSRETSKLPVIFIILILLVDWFLLGGRITRFIFLILLSGRRGGGGGFGSGGGGFSGGGGSGGGGGSSRSW